MTASEARWIVGRAAKKIGVFKRLISQRCTVDVDMSIEESRRLTTRAMNELDKMSRQSPFEHDLAQSGSNDDEEGTQVLDTVGWRLRHGEDFWPDKLSYERSARIDSTAHRE